MGNKWLDLLKQIVPGLARVSLVFNPDTSPQSKFFVPSIEAAASSFGVELVLAPVYNDADIETAIAGFSRQPNGGLILPGDSFTVLRRDLLVELAARYRLPAMYTIREFVTAGGLIQYGPEFADHFRQAASYVDRILKGAKPGDLPVQLPTKFTLTVNRKTAGALGIELPMGVLLGADEVIE
jgi:putative tryptophan/tyrosine transport system substrate-binding protein